MKKFLSILKASTTGDMNIFRFDFKKNSNTVFKKIRSTLLIIVVVAAILFSIGEYAYFVGEPLSKVNSTYIMLTLFLLLGVIVVFMEGFYKSQGILFDAKDNDLLFSMPIKKSTIFTIRVLKLLAFEYMFAFLFVLPAFAVYIYFETPGVTFYISSIVMLITLPIIPTIISCIFGYLIKMFSSFFKSKRLVQTITTLLLTLAIWFACFNMQGFIENLVKNATSINDLITKIYYPIGLYINCIQDFNILSLISILLINIVIGGLFILIFSSVYFKIISRSSENYSKSNYKLKDKSIKTTSQLKALVGKELKRYFSSPIYMMNTAFGIVLTVILTVTCSVNFESTFGMLKSAEIEIPTEVVYNMFPKLFMVMLLFVISTITLTASSISLEGKSINLTKSLPINTKTLFLSKIITNDIIAIPVLFICSIVLSITLKFTILDTIATLLLCVIFSNLIAISGLIVNLKFPLLNAKSDTVVVKQSASSIVALLSNFVIAFIPVILYLQIDSLQNHLDTYVYIVLLVYLGLTIGLWKILNSYGAKLFKKLNY